MHDSCETGREKCPGGQHTTKGDVLQRSSCSRRQQLPVFQVQLLAKLLTLEFLDFLHVDQRMSTFMRPSPQQQPNLMG
jgi:hypothetical protein